jgi:hypothetical protein
MLYAVHMELRTVTMRLNAEDWQAFRIACIQAGTNASKQVAALTKEWTRVQRSLREREGAAEQEGVARGKM